jgi:hypothetical protein
MKRSSVHVMFLGGETRNGGDRGGVPVVSLPGAGLLQQARGERGVSEEWGHGEARLNKVDFQTAVLGTYTYMLILGS